MKIRLSALIGRDLDLDPVIEGITADSRRVRKGYLFAALPGTHADGAVFAAKAVEAGAVAVIAGRKLKDLGVPVVVESDPRRAYALAAAAFHGRQPKTCVAITGTNGKTSVAGFCRQIYARDGHVSASMGTLGVRISRPGAAAADEQITPPGLTTPDAADVADLLARLARTGVTHLALEASSHGIDQRRLDGVRLRAAAFLNLTQDHLDYHGDMGAYRSAKLRLFEALLPQGAPAVVNADSDEYLNFATAAAGSSHVVVTVGVAGQAIRLAERTPTLRGQRLSIEIAGERHDVTLPLVGGFQASNALVALGLGLTTGVDLDTALSALEHLEGAPGRMQLVGAGGAGGVAYVDYAHTPDGLATVLGALRPHTLGRLIVVFGAGGDRDRGKRPIMGRIAGELADVAIVTDDNPRSEDPAAIRAEVRAGSSALKEISDRRAAIRAAVTLLGEGDVLVVAGKGHEQGQIIAGVTHPFDDVVETQLALDGVDA